MRALAGLVAASQAVLTSAQVLRWGFSDAEFAVELVSSIPGVANSGEAIKISIQCPGDKWCGFGFNTASQMSGADVFTFGNHGCCDPSGAPQNADWQAAGLTQEYGSDFVSLTQCNLNGYSIAVDSPVANQNIEKIEYTLADGVLKATGYRRLDTGDTVTPDFVLDKATQYDLIMAVGESLAVGYHGQSSSSTFRCKLSLTDGLEGCPEPGTLPDNSMLLAHVACMFIAWLVCAPLAVFMARFGKKRFPEGKWFRIHRGLQIVTVLFTIAGFGFIVASVESSSGFHFNTPKKILGLVVFILAVLQPLNAVIRPHPPAAGTPKPTSRVVWEVVHKGSGWLAVLLGLATSTLGMDLSESVTGMPYAVGVAFTAVWVAAAVVFEVRRTKA